MSGAANGGLIAIDAGLRQWRGSPNGAGYVAAVNRLPQGFLEERYRNGLAVCYIAYHKGRAHVSISCREPTNELRPLSRQWAQSALDDADVISDDVPTASAVMGAQERGEFCYVIFKRSSGVTGGIGSVFGVSEHLIRFNQASYAEARYHHPFKGGGEVTYTLSATAMFTEPYPEELFSLSSWNTALHVSDTFPPRLWYLSGERMIHWVDSDDPRKNQAPWSHRWRSRENLLSETPHYHGPWRIQYQGAHYVQHYPTNNRTRGPILVCPWRNRSTDPELWYLVEVDAGFKIYRARWRPGQWRRPKIAGNEVYDGTAEILDYGSGKYPKFNPDGYAFEHHWMRTSNLVGHIRGKPQNASLMGASIKIVRDARRIDCLWMIVTSGGAAYYGASFDDGATWGQMRRLPLPRTSGVNLVHGGMTSAATGTIDRRGALVLPGRGRISGTTVRSLLTSYRGSGVSKSAGRPYVFRRGESKGSTWL